MSNTLGFLKIGQPLNAKITNLVDMEGTAIDNLSDLKYWGSVKDALGDADAAAITKFDSESNVERFEFDPESPVLTIQLLSANMSENLITTAKLTVEETGLSLCGMPIVGYVFVDIWAKLGRVGPGQIFYEKIPVVQPATNSKQ